MNIKVALDLDDFSLENNNFFYLNELRKQYPNIKFSMFYIPADINYQSKLLEVQKDVVRNQIRKAVQEGWIELIPHGLMHVFGEYQKADYKSMEMTLEAYQEHFKDLDVPYVKGFKAPNWLISEEAIKCLDDNNWWLAIDRNQPDCLKAKRNYIYNWDIADDFPTNETLVKGHGHISLPSKNAFQYCLDKLAQIPPDAEFVFVSELMK